MSIHTRGFHSQSCRKRPPPPPLCAVAGSLPLWRLASPGPDWNWRTEEKRLPSCTHKHTYMHLLPGILEQEFEEVCCPVPGITTNAVLVGLSCLRSCCLVVMCVQNWLIQSSSMEYECIYQNEKSSSFITAVIECNLPAESVSLTQCICPPRCSSFQDLGFRSTLSALDHHVEVSCVKFLAGRLEYLCVISSYELLGSGCESLVLSVGRIPSRPKHRLWSHGWGGVKAFENPSLHPAKQEEAWSYPHMCMFSLRTHTHCGNPHAYSKWLVQPHPVASGSVSDSVILKSRNKQTAGQIMPSHTYTHSNRDTHNHTNATAHILCPPPADLLL